MFAPGDKVQHYEIIELLGKGGMGEVYLARDSILDRKVALKFLPDELEGDARTRERFVREAKSAAALDHPFICKIYETGESSGKAYISMEYIEGKTLKDRIEQDPLPLKDIIRVTLEIAEALEKAHKAGIVHRDLKPVNIMITSQGHTKVMDFGLAKRILPGGGTAELSRTLTQASITEQGSIAGTIAYMSPEQAKGESVDTRSDIFSLGIILYEMLSGKHPFSKPSPIETLTSILRDSVPPPHITPKSVNPILNPILRKALAKKPADRYQSISDFVADLRKAQIEKGFRIHLPLRLLLISAASILVIAIAVIAVLWLGHPSGEIKPKPGKPGPRPISVLIADFENKTGDAVFDGAIEQLLGISLEGASFISVYERAQARKLGTQLDPSADGQLTAKLAQLISNREGINVVIDASIEPDKDGYLIKVWAIDTIKNEQIAEATRKIKTKADVGKAVDYLSASLQSELGGAPSESAQALAGETFTVSSLAAMNAYARGQELNYQGKREEAIQWFLKALDHDPNLGRAYASLGVIYNNLQKHEESDKYFGMAMSRIDQMSEREKLRTLGTYYLIKKNYPKAIEEFTTLIEKYPADISAYTNLAFAHFQSRNMALAEEVGRRAVEFNPKKSIYRYNQIWYALGAGDFKAAEEEVNSLLELEPNYAEAYVCKGLLNLVQGQTAQATEAYRVLEGQGSYGKALAATGLADIAAYEGRLYDASNLLEQGIAFDLKNDQSYVAADKYIALAQAYLLMGKKDLALKAADKAVATSRIEEMLFSAAEIYIQTGQQEKARDLAAELSKKIQPAHRAFAKLIGGELSKARGDVPGAIQVYREAQALVDMWYGRFLLGCAYLETEAYSEAYSEFDQCLKRRGEATSVFFTDLPTYRYLPPVYYYLGRAQEGLKSNAASDSYKAFLAIKDKADGDWMVKDARLRIKNS
jgi:serine/threonine protein kinase/tetratricopeptide (TPR) repeat protein